MKKPLTLTTTMVNDVPTAHVIRDADDWGIARLHPAVFFHQCGEALVRAYNLHDDLVQMIARIVEAHDYAENVSVTEGMECLATLVKEAQALLARVAQKPE